jgi:hypothetical protein
MITATLRSFANVTQFQQGSDFGIDIYCELFSEEGFPTGKVFNVQCKGKEEVEQGDGNLKISVKVSTANYRLILPSPTFLIVVDIETQHCYWSYPRPQLEGRDDWQTQKTVTIYVPTHNVFSLGITRPPSAMEWIIDEVVSVSFQKILLQLDELYKKLTSAQGTLDVDLSPMLRDAADDLDALHRISELANAYAQRIQATAVKAMKKERERSGELLSELDYTPGSASLWGAEGSIFTFEFGAGSVNDVWSKVDSDLDYFTSEPTQSNYRLLLASFARLIQLNRDMYWSIKLLVAGPLL